MFQHGITAAMESFAEVGPRYMLKGIQPFVRTSNWGELRDFIYERSAEMRNRGKEIERDIREQLNTIHLQQLNPLSSRYSQVAGFLQEHAYDGIAMLDMASAMPTWLGAYLKGLDKVENGGLGLNEADAIYFADKNVRNAHGGGGVKDMAAAQRGNESQKLLTMFYTFWNHNFNRIRDILERTRYLREDYQEGKESGNMGKFWGNTGFVVGHFLAYTLFVQMIHHWMHAFTGATAQDDQDEGTVKWFAKQMALAAAGGIPGVRDAANWMINGKDWELSPITSMGKTFGLLGDDLIGKREGHLIKDLMAGAGYGLNLPLGQAGATLQFIWDYWDGEQSASSLSEVMRGILTGHSEQH